jgi:general secretion pathway protein H
VTPIAVGKRVCYTRVRAFTLIEILVVVVIVGIISSFLLLSIGLLGNDRALDQQARRLGSLLELSLEEAVLQGRDFGLELMRGGYRFVELDPVLNQWSEIAGDELLRPRQLDEGMELDLFIEDRRIPLATEATDIDSRDADSKDRDSSRNPIEDYAPHVLILSSGDISPFTLNILRHADRAQKTLTVSLAGEIEIDAEGDDEM